MKTFFLIHRNGKYAIREKVLHTLKYRDSRLNLWPFKRVKID